MAAALLRRLLLASAPVGTFTNPNGTYYFGLSSYGGCSGMSYLLEFDTEKGPHDKEFDIDGVKIVIDHLGRPDPATDTNTLWLTGWERSDLGPVLATLAGPGIMALCGDTFFDDLIAPIDYTLADTQIGSGYGVTALPHLRDFAITGPHRVTGVSDTPSRRRIFTCRPLSANEEIGCARKIVGQLASSAYRRPAAKPTLGLADALAASVPSPMAAASTAPTSRGRSWRARWSTSHWTRGSRSAPGSRAAERLVGAISMSGQ